MVFRGKFFHLIYSISWSSGIEIVPNLSQLLSDDEYACTYILVFFLCDTSLKMEGFW